MTERHVGRNIARIAGWGVGADVAATLLETTEARQANDLGTSGTVSRFSADCWFFLDTNALLPYKHFSITSQARQPEPFFRTVTPCPKSQCSWASAFSDSPWPSASVIRETRKKTRIR